MMLSSLRGTPMERAREEGKECRLVMIGPTEWLDSMRGGVEGALETIREQWGAHLKADVARQLAGDSGHVPALLPLHASSVTALSPTGAYLTLRMAKVYPYDTMRRKCTHTTRVPSGGLIDSHDSPDCGCRRFHAEEISEKDSVNPGGFSVKCSRLHGDRVVLVGDAGHSMLPSLGLGCNTALESAVVLGRALKGERGTRSHHVGARLLAPRWRMWRILGRQVPVRWHASYWDRRRDLLMRWHIINGTRTAHDRSSDDPCRRLQVDGRHSGSNRGIQRAEAGGREGCRGHVARLFDHVTLFTPLVPFRCTLFTL